MDVEYLSKPIQIGNKTAANRFVVLPNESNDGLDSGAPSERSIGRYKKYFEGQAGIVFAESTMADIGGRARIHQLYLGDETVDGFARMIEELRKANPEVIYIIQVDHCGSLADPDFADPIAIYPRESEPARLLTEIAELDYLGALLGTIGSTSIVAPRGATTCTSAAAGDHGSRRVAL